MSTRGRTPVFTFWAWLILAPPLITVWGGYAEAMSGGTRLTGLLAAIGVHLVLGVVFWLASLVERRLAGGRRWAWVLAVLLVISVLRPTVADLLQRWAGLQLETLPFGIRVALNLVGFAVVLLIIHLAFAQVAEAADTRRRLAAVLARTEAQRAETEVRQAALIIDYQRTIADPIRQAMATVDATAPPARVTAQLMHVAHDVVRPLADRTFALASDTTEYQYRPPNEPTTGPTPTRLSTPQRIEATLPLAPAAVWFVLQLPIALLVHDLLLGSAVALASTAVVLAGGWLIRRQRLPSSPLLAIGVLAVEYGAVGALATLALIGLDPGAFNAGFWVYGILMATVTGTILSLGRSRQLDYLDSEEQLVGTLLRARCEANAAHAQLATTTNLLARRLHAAIQTDVVAAAFQVRLGADDPAALVAALEARIERVLAAPMLPSEVDDEGDAERPYAEGIRAAMVAADQAWREGIDLVTTYDEPLWQWLADHPEYRATLREVVLLALTNTIRFSRIRRASLHVRVEGDRLCIEVRTPGRLLANDLRRRGVAELASRVRHAQLVQEGDDVVHRVVL